MSRRCWPATSFAPRFSNNAKGFALLLQWLQDHAPGSADELHVCMESTGSYQEQVACFLIDQGLLVSVVNPLLVKRFAEANRQRNKTDEADAKGFGAVPPKPAPRALERSIAQRACASGAGGKARYLASHAPGREQSSGGSAHASVAESIRSVIAVSDEQIARVKQQDSSRIDDDPQLKGRADLLQTIRAWATGRIRNCWPTSVDRSASRAPGAAAYASLTPLVRQSGTFAGQAPGDCTRWDIARSSTPCILRHGGCTLQPGRGSVRAALEGAEQARQGDHRGLHAQAPVDRPRRASLWKALRRRPSRRFGTDNEDGVYFAPQLPAARARRPSCTLDRPASGASVQLDPGAGVHVELATTVPAAESVG